MYRLILLLIFCLPCLLFSAPRHKAQRVRTANTKVRSKRQHKSNSKQINQAKFSSKKRSKGYTRQQRKKRLNNTTLQQEARIIDYSLRRQELYRQDSIRLRNGGTVALPRIVEKDENIGDIEPQQLRFYKADTTLTMNTIASLYFAREVSADDSIFFGQIIPKVDTAIEQARYKEALSLAKKGLFRNPTHLGLLKRACELAQHEKSEQLTNYIWQVTELFNLIQHTGDGKSPQSAWCVMDFDDALLYEHLWLETEMSQILDRQVNTYQGQTLLILDIEKKGKKEKHYFLIGKKG